MAEKVFAREILMPEKRSMAKAEILNNLRLRTAELSVGASTVRGLGVPEMPDEHLFRTWFFAAGFFLSNEVPGASVPWQTILREGNKAFAKREVNLAQRFLTVRDGEGYPGIGIVERQPP